MIGTSVSFSVDAFVSVPTSDVYVVAVEDFFSYRADTQSETYLFQLSPTEQYLLSSRTNASRLAAASKRSHLSKGELFDLGPLLDQLGISRSS